MLYPIHAMLHTNTTQTTLQAIAKDVFMPKVIVIELLSWHSSLALFAPLSQKVGEHQVNTKIEVSFITSLGQNSWVRVIFSHNYVISTAEPLYSPMATQTILGRMIFCQTFLPITCFLTCNTHVTVF